jgi:hypothetical protein
MVVQYEGGGKFRGDKYQCPDCGDEAIIVNEATSTWQDGDVDLEIKSDWR